MGVLPAPDVQLESIRAGFQQGPLSDDKTGRFASIGENSLIGRIKRRCRLVELIMAKAKKTASKSKSKSEPKAKKTKSVVAAAGTKAKAKKAASGTKRTKVRKQEVGVFAGVPDASPDEFSTFTSGAPEAGSYSSEAASYS